MRKQQLEAMHNSNNTDSKVHEENEDDYDAEDCKDNKRSNIGNIKGVSLHQRTLGNKIKSADDLIKLLGRNNECNIFIITYVLSFIFRISKHIQNN